MNKTVAIWRHRKSGAFVLHPYGTFRGYGGLVGIFPYTELDAEIEPTVLGAAIVSFLDRSTAQDCHIRDARDFLESLQDLETRQVRAKYGLDSSTVTTGILAKRFRNAQIEIPRRCRSWTITPMVYSTSSKIDKGVNARALRVGFSGGPRALGTVVISVLPR